MDGSNWDAAKELVIWGTVLAMGLAVAVYAIGKVRGMPAQSERPTSELLSKFRKLHSEGGLSDEEFRTIKANLADDFQAELKDSDETGCDA